MAHDSEGARLATANPETEQMQVALQMTKFVTMHGAQSDIPLPKRAVQCVRGLDGSLVVCELAYHTTYRS